MMPLKTLNPLPDILQLTDFRKIFKLWLILASVTLYLKEAFS